MDRMLTMLDESGDTTITWNADRDEEMEATIAKKMAEGVTFYILPPPRAPGTRGRKPAPKPLKNPAKAREHRALSVKDEDFAKLVSAGTADVAPRSEAEGALASGEVRRAKTAKEVASGRSVATRARAGG